MNKLFSPMAEGFVEAMRLARDMVVLPFCAVFVVLRQIVAAFVRHDRFRRVRTVKIVRLIGRNPGASRESHPATCD